MSWFDEQIEQRKKQDSELFADSLEGIANSVTGGKPSGGRDEAVNDEIKTILNYYGFKSKTEVPPEITSVGDRVSFLCRPLGVMFRQINLTGEWWKDSIGALLAFKSDGTAIALLPDGLGYHFYNNGKKERVNKNNAPDIGSDAYCFYKPLPNRKINIFDLLKYAVCTRSIRDIILTVAFAGIIALIGLFTPRISYFLYGNVVESGSNELLISTVVFFLCVSVSTILFRAFQTLFETTMSTKMNIALQSASMMRVLSLPPSFFRKYASGELAQRANYLPVLTQTLVEFIFGTGLTSVFSLIYINSIFEYAPSLVVPSLSVMVVTVAFSLFCVFARQKISRETMEISSKESGMTYAMISGIKKIRTAGAEKRAFARWAELYAKKAQLTYNPPRFIKVSDVITLAISSVGTLIMYYLSIENGVDIAEYTAFTAAYGMIFGALSSLTSLATTYSNIKPIINMAKPIMDEEPEISENKEIVSRLNGRVEFNNVVFSYEEGMPNIVDNMSFKIEPNQYIGIVGKTGCGKSTLIRLLLGFEKPQKGAVYYDGKDINTLDLKSLRRKIGVVMQDSKLFGGDIFSNITISAPWLTVDDAWEAAEIAGIADDIEDMPMGMHTLISEGSGGISGGQRQRLVIARAIAPKPKVLIFDEATSALDNVTQKKVSEALDTLNCTRIVIAHRLSTIKHCDRILYLGDGKILEDGTYDELIEKKGLFYELVERQRLDTHFENGGAV